MQIKLFLYLIVAVFSLNAAQITEIFVDSETGSDSGDGSPAQPFKTLEKARDSIRKLKGNESFKGARVEVNGSFAYPEKPFTLSKEDSGFKDAPIEWCAGKKGAVILGAWKFKLDEFDGAPGGVRKIDLKKRGIPLRRPKDQFTVWDFGEVYDSHRALKVARFPNRGWLTIPSERVIDRGVIKADKSKGREFELGSIGGTFIYEGKDINPSKWDIDKGVWAYGYFCMDWYSEAVRIGSCDIEKKHVKFAGVPYFGLGVRDEWKKHVPPRRYYIFNTLSELDEPGEWYCDVDEGILYVWPEDSGDIYFAVSEQGALFLDEVSNLSIRGIKVANTGGTTSKRPFVYTGGKSAVTVRESTDVILDGMEVTLTQANGIEIVGGKRVTIKNCHVHHTGAVGISGVAGSRRSLEACSHRITRSKVHHPGRNSSIAVGVYLDGVGWLFDHNLIRDTPYIALRYAGNENIIEDNEMYCVMMEGADGGAIYTGRDWGSQGNIVRRNYIHHLGTAGREWRRERGLPIEFESGAEKAGSLTMGVYLDDCDSGDIIEDNIFEKTGYGVFVGGGRHNMVRGNIMIDCYAACHLDTRGLVRARPGKGIANDTWDLLAKIEKFDFRSSPWKDRYPWLLTYMDDEPLLPLHTEFTSNKAIDCVKFFNLSGSGVRDVLNRLKVENNIAIRTPADPARGVCSIVNPHPGCRKKSGGKVNLLNNPSFEEWKDGEIVPDHWTTGDKKTGYDVISRMSAQGTDGENSVQFKNGGMGNALRQRVKVTPGKYYNISVDAKTDIGMYQFRVMPYWQSKSGKRLKDANSYAGKPSAEVKTPWTRIELKNYLAPTNAEWLVVSFVPNDAWSGNKVPGIIMIDNASVTESGAVFDDVTAEVLETEDVKVLRASLSPKYDRGEVLVKAASKPIAATFIADEIVEGGKCVIGAQEIFSLLPGEEKTLSIPLDTTTRKARFSIWMDGKLIWRKSFTGDEKILRLDILDPFDVRKGMIFVPNDAVWYVNFPIRHNLPCDRKKNPNRILGNPSNVNARMFFELPKGIDIKGVKYSDWGGDLPFRKIISSNSVTVNGEERVIWELPIFISGVNQPLVFFTSCLPEGSEKKGRCWLTWKGGAQVPRELTFRTVSYGRVKPFEKMQLRMDDLTPNLAEALNCDAARELPSLGINSFRVPFTPSKKKNVRTAEFVKKIKESGCKWYFYIPNEISLQCWANDMSWGNHAGMKGDKEARFIGLDGKSVKSIYGWIPPCPTYRGENFRKEVEYILNSEAVRDYGVTWLVCDWECWPIRPCYCQRCIKMFREKWLKEKGLEDFGDPREFMKDIKANAAAAKEFNDFYWWTRGTVYTDIKKELNKGLDPKRTNWNAPKEGSFVMSDWTAPRKHLMPGMDWFDWSFGYKTPESVMQRVEDIFTNVLNGATGQFTCSVCPMQGCELCEKYPPESTYYNILEAATLGTRGFQWWYAPICESMTWKYVMDGLREIRPYENLILTGKVTVRGDGENCTWRKIANGKEALYLVRNYNLVEETVVSFSDNGRTFKVRLGPKRLAKLIYVK